MALGVSLCLVLGAHLQAENGVEEGPVSNEFQVKAAFLLNFLKFVEWPEPVLANANAPMIIGILGDDPFGNALPETLHDESVHGHPLVLRRSHNLDDLRDCQLLFVARSESGHEAKILAHLRDAPILTVSDSDDFCVDGGVIQLYLENKKVHFMINQGVAQHLGLKVSSQLLSLAKVLGATSGDKKD